jgi:hypothetical protein
VPFTGDSEWEVLKQHETKEPELPPHLTARERAVLQRCLHKDPAARYQSVHDVIAACGDGLRALPRETPGAGVAADAPAAPVPPLRGCVPPPLPVAGGRARRRAAAAPGRRSAGARVATMLLIAACAVFALKVLRSRDDDRRSATRYAMASPPAGTRPAPRGPKTLAASVDQVVASVHKSVRTAVQRQQRTRLRDFDGDQFAMPRDFRAYVEQVAELARAPSFSPGHAAKLARLGRAAFVAGVAMLHDLDYDDPNDCRRAANVQRLLGHMSAIQGVEVAVTPAEPCESDVCRCLAIADGWRRIAEQFARTEGAWQQLLERRGKTAGVQR